MLLGARAALWGRMRREFREEVGQWNVHSQPCSTGYFLFHFQSFFLSLCLSVSVCLSSCLSVSSSSISYTLCFILYYDRSLPRFPCFWMYVSVCLNVLLHHCYCRCISVCSYRPAYEYLSTLTFYVCTPECLFASLKGPVRLCIYLCCPPSINTCCLSASVALCSYDPSPSGWRS